MATYVLVPGGAHGGWCYQPVARILRQAGHDVYALTLTGVGERSHLLRPDIDLELHINDVVQVLRYEELRDVILVGHSYGGMVITGVADRVTDRIGHLVYLDAATPVDGESVVGISATLAAVAQDSRVVDGVELTLFPGTGPQPYYGVTDPGAIAWMDPKLTPHPVRCFTTPLRLNNEAALWEVPQTHIVCTATLPYRDRARMAKAAAAGRVWDIDTGHDLMITEPKAVADLLLRVPQT